MAQKIYRTKRYTVWGAVVCFLWLYLITTLINHEACSELPVIKKLEGALNISLLIVGVIFIRCLFLLFKQRPLLQAGENGLYLQVSKKNRGIVPWRHITHFACLQDRWQIRIYLRGLWDVPDDCGEKFDIQIDEDRQRMIVLHLRHKVGNLERVRDELEEWLLYYSDGEVSRHLEMDERSQRRMASAKKQGASAVLVLLYFIRSKFWIFAIIAFLFFAAWIEKLTEYSRPTVLIIAVIPALLVSIIIRRLLSKVILSLERSKEKNQGRMVGL